MVAVYAILLLAPAVDGHASRVRLRDAANALGSAITTVEASYAAGDLTLTDQHLGLPASAAYCSHLRASLPDTGHAVLSCELRETAALRGSVRWSRTASGQWRCHARIPGVRPFPLQCPAE
ncbi:TPA: pilin [Stenotrophomonas maltophilia]|nr:pilin [Stenotrophomonas maltophilia]HEL3778927.1 pilin [Stenotrophomonas maltophilia]HEL3782176.1 pilin [Stenotrophomonas maltophilia]HEL5004343.1 pilin [Stenotrophomonas maltophilia]